MKNIIFFLLFFSSLIILNGCVHNQDIGRNEKGDIISGPKKGMTNEQLREYTNMKTEISLNETAREEAENGTFETTEDINLKTCPLLNESGQKLVILENPYKGSKRCIIKDSEGNVLRRTLVKGKSKKAIYITQTNDELLDILWERKSTKQPWIGNRWTFPVGLPIDDDGERPCYLYDKATYR